MVQNLKKNWIFVSKMTRIWQIFIRILESLKIGIFTGFFCPKQKMYQLQTYRGVISNDTEEWWKIWEELTCRFKIDIRNLMNLTRELESLEIYTLMGCFWPKFIYNVWTKNVQRGYFWWHWILIQNLKEK